MKVSLVSSLRKYENIGIFLVLYEEE